MYYQVNQLSIRRSVVGNISSIVRTSSGEYGGGGGFGIADGECCGDWLLFTHS